MNNWGPVKKQATRLVAAWLDKQNKQMPVAITSTLPPCFAKLGRRTRLTAGYEVLLRICYFWGISWYLIDVCGTDTEFFLTRRMTSQTLCPIFVRIGVIYNPIRAALVMHIACIICLFVTWIIVNTGSAGICWIFSIISKCTCCSRIGRPIPFVLKYFVVNVEFLQCILQFGNGRQEPTCFHDITICVAFVLVVTIFSRTAWGIIQCHFMSRPLVTLPICIHNLHGVTPSPSHIKIVMASAWNSQSTCYSIKSPFESFVGVGIFILSIVVRQIFFVIFNIDVI